LPTNRSLGHRAELQLRRLRELGVQTSATRRGIFSSKGSPSSSTFLGADVAPGREHVAVRGDFGGGGRLAESRQHPRTCRPLCLRARRGRWDDLLEVGVGQLAVDAVDQGAQLARVDEKRLFAAVAAFAVGSFFAMNQRQTGICVL
jgi:hypothetical protein